VRRLLGRLPPAWSREHLPQQAMTRPGRRLGLGLTALVEATRLGVDFDAVETPDYFSPGWAIALSRRWPVLTVLHSPLDIEIRYSNLPSRTYLQAAAGIEREAAKFSSRVSAPSRNIRDELLDLAWKTVERATVDPIGVDVREVHPVVASRGTPRILVAGHITPRKGHDVLACAAGILARRGSPVEVLVAGSYGLGFWSGRPFQQRLEGLISRSGVAWRFIGHVERSGLLDVYKQATAVVVPSRFESFSIVALEALLAGRPVVVTDRCGIAERVAPGRQSGLWTARAGDPSSLADTLEEVLDLASVDPVGIGEAARASGLAAGDVDRLVDTRLALYRRLGDD
jgi:glycogen(starch) synthase